MCKQSRSIKLWIILVSFMYAMVSKEAFQNWIIIHSIYTCIQTPNYEHLMWIIFHLYFEWNSILESRRSLFYRINELSSFEIESFRIYLHCIRWKRCCFHEARYQKDISHCFSSMFCKSYNTSFGCNASLNKYCNWFTFPLKVRDYFNFFL